jgi:hypothetical protein
MIALDDYYEKGSLVLLFIPENLAANELSVVNDINEQLNRIEGENAHLIGIFPQSFADLQTNQHPSFPILINTHNSLRESYTDLVAPGLIGEKDIMLFILDTYGAPYVCLVEQKHGENIIDELLSWLLFINIQCPE